MGNGRRRSISCPSCNGLADGNKLLAPVALAAGIDGSLYVGDLNFVRRVYPSLNTTRVLELRYGLLTCNWGTMQFVVIKTSFMFANHTLFPLFPNILCLKEIRIFDTGELLLKITLHTL